MTDKKIKQEEFIRQHTLTPDQLKKLLEDKMERARQYFEANKKREAIYGGR
jgi:hypothetical protein